MGNEHPANPEVKRKEKITSFSNEIGVNKIPNLRIAEKLYIRLLTRDIKLIQQENGDYRLDDPKKQALLDKLVYWDEKKRPFSEVLKLINPPEEAGDMTESIAQFIGQMVDVLTHPIKYSPVGFVASHAQRALKGELIEQSLEEEGEMNCFEYSLLASLIAKMYYSTEGVEAYPLGYNRLHPDQEKPGKTRTSRHFMLFWYDHNDQEEPVHITQYRDRTSKDRDIKAIFKNSSRESNETLDGVAQTAQKLIDMVEARQ